MTEQFPVSHQWLNMVRKLGGVDVLRGILQNASTESLGPFWCRQLCNVVPTELHGHFDAVIPFVKETRLGNKPHTPKTDDQYKYCTKAWSTSPCSCIYKYDGFDGKRNRVLIIGDKAPRTEDSNGIYVPFC